MSNLLQDIRLSVRMMRNNPGFTAAAMLALALGIGANTAVFTVVNSVLLRPLPFPQPERLYFLSCSPKNTPFGPPHHRLGGGIGISDGPYLDIRDQIRSFGPTAVFDIAQPAALAGPGEAMRVGRSGVTREFLDVLGVSPAMGHAPLESNTVMLSDQLWRDHFRADRGVLGQVVNLDGVPHTVVGVLPAGVEFPFVGKADVWTPRYFELTLMPAARIRMGVGYLSFAARLGPGATLDQANAELAVLDHQYRAENPTAPDAGSSRAMIATPLRDVVVADLRSKLWILSAAVALLLLIGCANVASLLLSRALARRRELAIRAALGASRGDVLRQMLTESMILALAAGLLGIALGFAADRALTAWGSTQLPNGIPVTLDARVLLFAVVISFLTGILTGVFPALQMARADLNSTLRDEGRGLAGSRSRARLRSVLVIGQVALSLLLLIGAGLLVRSFDRLLHVDPGFEAHNVLTMGISLPTEKYASHDQQIAFFDEALRRVSALPGVRSAAISAALPLSFTRVTPVLPEGQPAVPLAQRPFIDIEAISPGWFSTMRVPLLAGRTFTDGDDLHAPKVVIVNQSCARTFWPGQNPIGKTFIVGRGPDASQVVGVSADVRNHGLADETQPQLYLPFKQLPWTEMNLLVRTEVPPLQMASAVHAQISAVDPDQPVTAIQSVDDLMDAGRAQPRFTMVLLAVFSITALALAAIGLAAMLAWTVVARRQEMAIRMALGAERRDILWIIVRHGLVLAASGIAIGLAAGLLLTRLMASVLYKTSARDLSTFALAPIVFLGIAWLASWLPARRATKVDPLDTLKAG